MARPKLLQPYCLAGLLLLLVDLRGQRLAFAQDKSATLLQGTANTRQVLTKEQEESRRKHRDDLNGNLKSILEHETALELECAKYHKSKVDQLEYLVHFNEHHEQVELPKHLTVKVPKVCLFLLSHFDQVGAIPLEELSPQFGDESGRKKHLELVNWIYSSDEILALNNGTSSNHLRKRETIVEGESLPRTDLLADYLYDPSLALSQPVEGEIGPNIAGFHRDIELAMEDPRFNEIIDINRKKLSPYLSPVVLVPGLLGTRLQARTDKTRRVNLFCSKQTDWQDLWLSIRQLLPLASDCWFDNVRLEFNPTTGFSREPEGVQSRIADSDGALAAVEFLDKRQPALTEYFAPIVTRYVQLGYTPNVNLLAAPYDFRLAPQELTGFFENLKGLIEEAQQSASKPVTLVCHSMGCTHLLIFLRDQSAAWRQSRVRKLIALSSPWGGAAKALKALLVGDQLDMPLLSPSKVRKLVKTFPSIPFLLPQAEVFSQPSKNHPEPNGGPVLVQTPERSYRATDMEDLLRDANLTTQLDWYKRTVTLIKPLEPLADLRVDCIHSINTPTPETLIFRNQSEFPSGDYELVQGDGDGTVNLESLLVCDTWAKQLPELVKHKIIMNTNHVGVLRHKSTLMHITDDVLTGS